MSQIDLRLIGPLNRIAELAVAHAPFAERPELDLFGLRDSIGSQQEAIAAYLRQLVEAQTNGSRTVRGLADPRIRLFGRNSVHLVECSAQTPEGPVQYYSDGMHPFAVCGSIHGYCPLSSPQ